MAFMDLFNPGVAPGITAERLNAPFNIESLQYSAGTNTIDITFGRGREVFPDAIVEKTTSTTYQITSPTLNTTYYLYLKKDGTFTHNISGVPPANGILLWTVKTGASDITVLTKTDKRSLVGMGTVTALRNLMYGCILLGMFSENLSKGAIVFDSNGKPQSQIISSTSGLSGTITWDFSVANQVTERIQITAPIALTITKVTNLTNYSEEWAVS